jgi:hypothetical protein
MDFIVELSLSKRYAQIWVIGDHFTNTAHLIPLKDKHKKTPNFVPILVNHFLSHVRLLLDIVSDSNRHFRSKLWSK